MTKMRIVFAALLLLFPTIATPAIALSCPASIDVFEWVLQSAETPVATLRSLVSKESGAIANVNQEPLLKLTRQTVSVATIDGSRSLRLSGNDPPVEFYAVKLRLTDKAAIELSKGLKHSHPTSLFVASIDGKSSFGMVQITRPFDQSIELFGGPFITVLVRSLDDAALLENCVGQLRPGVN